MKRFSPLKKLLPTNTLNSLSSPMHTKCLRINNDFRMFLADHNWLLHSQLRSVSGLFPMFGPWCFYTNLFDLFEQLFPDASHLFDLSLCLSVSVSRSMRVICQLTILFVIFSIRMSHVQWLQGCKKVKAQGIGVHKPEEIEEFGKNDLAVLSDILADKPFFFGDEPTTVSISDYH